jgi:hypothetical protein
MLLYLNITADALNYQSDVVYIRRHNYSVSEISRDVTAASKGV